MHPTIRHIEQKRLFRFVWLKYVTGVNTNVHCARCLLGYYSERISPTLERLTDIRLSERDCKYYYLCGVSSPYRWEENFHIAFRFKPGATLRVNELGIELEIENAERIPIVKLEKYNHPKGKLGAYTTCRNWQFAMMIASEFNRTTHEH